LQCIALRYVTEILPCPEVATLKVGTRSATPNARLDTARAAMPISQHRLSAVDRRSPLQRWHDAVAGLLALQAEYAARCDALPGSLRDSATAAALQVIVDLDELTAIVPPRGYGRD